jgi:chromosome segregation ATPase
MTSEQHNEKPNITEQMYRETSEHFMEELKKKEKIIDFLKNRLKDVESQKNYIEKCKDKLKYALQLQADILNANTNSMYESLTEISNRNKYITDSSTNIDNDIEDFIENYLDNISSDIDIELELTEYTNN